VLRLTEFVRYLGNAQSVELLRFRQHPKLQSMEPTIRVASSAV
jgi:hypothetical protein